MWDLKYSWLDGFHGFPRDFSPGNSAPFLGCLSDPLQGQKWPPTIRGSKGQDLNHLVYIILYAPIPSASGLGVGFSYLNTFSQGIWSTREYTIFFGMDLAYFHCVLQADAAWFGTRRL